MALLTFLFRDCGDKKFEYQVVSDFKTLKKAAKNADTTLPKVKIALLGDTATQFLATAIKGAAQQNGFYADLFEAEFNQVEQQIFDPESDLHKFQPQFTVIFQSTHKYLTSFESMSSCDKPNAAQKRIDFLKEAKGLLNSKLIICNYPEIDDGVFGQYGNKTAQSFIYQNRKINYLLMEFAEQYSDVFICDLSSLQNKFGRDFCFDSSVYTSTEMVLSVDFVPYVAQRIVDITAAVLGKFKKCLIMDLDNTLWGGVIGDDGIENIKLGHGLGIGKAFTELQLWIKQLKERGIILAVCSKNNEETAKEPFVKHPEMVLKLSDIAVFTANWDTKVENIMNIQQILNIAFDSMVFIDDNPFERNIVRENISGISVPELPEDPADYLEFLYSENLFETASFSSGDKDRTKQYQVEAERITERKKFADEGGFLKSLNMVSEVQGFTKFLTPRIAQLTQRSNQFNLRTIRYTEEDIARLENSDNHKCFSFTLEDRFGDNGMICVIVLEKRNELKDLFIDTWLMSCRVLKRGMENFTLNAIVNYAKSTGFKTITGEYIPTLKNSMVKDHYPKLGFAPVEGKENLWVLDVDSYQEKQVFIKEK